MTPEQKTLFSTLDFCKNYDLEAWIQERNTCNLLLLGTKNSFQSIKNKPNYFLLNKEYIKNNLFSFDPLNNNNHQITIHVTPDNSLVNNSLSVNYITYLLWYGPKGCAQEISKYWFLNNFQLEKSLLFKTPEFPSGFFDTNIVPYNLNKNWRHFCDLIDDEKFISYFNNNKNILSFSNTLDTIFTNYPEKNLHLHSIFRTILLKTSQSNFHLDKDNEDHLGFMIFKLFEKHLPDSELLNSYTQQISSIKFLINNKNKQNLFINTDPIQYSVDSFELNKMQIIQTFYEQDLPLHLYVFFTEQIFTHMDKSQTLKSIGLKKLDFLKKADDFTIYCTFDKNNSLKQDIQDIYLKLMDQFIQNHSTNIEYGSFIDTFIEHYYLSKNLPNNNLTSQNKRKI